MSETTNKGDSDEIGSNSHHLSQCFEDNGRVSVYHSKRWKAIIAYLKVEVGIIVSILHILKRQLGRNNMINEKVWEKREQEVGGD